MKVIQASFIGGEYSPDMQFKVTDQSVSFGLVKCVNMIPQPSGILRKRPGTEYIGEMDKSNIRIFRYYASSRENAIMVFSDKKINIYTRFGVMTNRGSSTPFTIPSPYPANVLHELSIVQDGTKLTICHTDYPPMELKPLGSHSFEFSQLNLSNVLQAPIISDIRKTNTEPELAERTYHYAVSATTKDGIEGALSAEAQIKNQMLNTGSFNHIEWTPVTNAEQYNVYRKVGGTFGLVATLNSNTRSFDDFNYTADTSTPPKSNEANLFIGDGNYPSQVSYVQNRRVFASTKNEPYTLWFSRANNDYDFSFTNLNGSAERIKMRVLSNNISKVRHIISTSKVMLMTADSEWAITGEPFTPTSISAQIQSNIGASAAKPLVINNSILFASNAGSRIFEVGYNWQAGGMVSGDITIRVPHLFKGRRVKRMESTTYPERCVWTLFDNGTMIGAVYIPEQQILSWFQTEFNGNIVDICSLNEDGYDSLYMAVERNDKIYIERMNFNLDVSADCHFHYKGNEVNSVSGLNMFTGANCVVAFDDAVEFVKCDNGTVTTKTSFKEAYIGIEIKSGIIINSLPNEGNDVGITENINLSNINLYYAGVGKINVDYGAIKKELKVDSTGTDEYDFAREEVRIPAKWMPAKKTRIEIRSGYDFEVKAIQFEYTTNTRYE